MPFGEADTRAKLIDPALHSSGWSEDFMTREELTEGAVEIVNGTPRRVTGRTDYTLRIKISPSAQPVAIAIVEAKAENLPANHGLEQAKCMVLSNGCTFHLYTPRTVTSFMNTIISPR